MVNLPSWAVWGGKGWRGVLCHAQGALSWGICYWEKAEVFWEYRKGRGFPATVARSPFQIPCSLSFSFGCEGLCRGSFSSPQVDSCSRQLCSPRQNIAASPAMQTGDKWVKNNCNQVLSCPVPSLMPSADILFPNDNYIFPFFSCPVPSFLLVAFEFQLLIIALLFIIRTYFH